MLERELFASFNLLQQGRYQSPQFKVGASASLVTHILFFIVGYSVSIHPSVNQGVPAGTENGGGAPPGQIVEVYSGPLIMPPPEVIRQLLGETKSAKPVRPDFIAERSSVAQGEANPNPRGSSQLPRGSGEGRGIPASTGSNPAKSQSSPDRIEEKSASSREEPSQQKSQREVVKSTDRLPTVASKPTPTPSRGEKQRTTQPPDQGVGPDIAKLGGSTRELPATVGNQDSAIKVQGPISVNAKGVGAIEEYRVYLEQAIQRRWEIPAEAALLSQPVSLTIEFTIAQDGRLLSIRLHNSTGLRSLDRAAQRAIELAAPFRPLPSVFPGPSQVFTDTFVYYPPPSS